MNSLELVDDEKIDLPPLSRYPFFFPTPLGNWKKWAFAAGTRHVDHRTQANQAFGGM